MILHARQRPAGDRAEREAIEQPRELYVHFHGMSPAEAAELTRQLNGPVLREERSGVRRPAMAAATISSRLSRCAANRVGARAVSLIR